MCNDLINKFNIKSNFKYIIKTYIVYYGVGSTILPCCSISIDCNSGSSLDTTNEEMFRDYGDSLDFNIGVDVGILSFSIGGV